ncbi:MAG: site-2 protease family protein [Actinomycetota bacterium]
MSSPLLGLLSTNPVLFALLGVSLIAAISLHEFGHAYAADLQGDRLPRASGRLSLNPARHLDPLGTIFIFLVGFGWGKPVEFRPNALSSRRFGAALVALAGPFMNLLLAAAGALLFRFVADPVTIDLARVGIFPSDASVGARFAFLFTSINVLLAVFNLIPLPPLDGSRLLTIFLPPNRQNIIFFLDRWGFLILLGLLFFGGFALLEPILGTVSRVIFSLASL